MTENAPQNFSSHTDEALFRQIAAGDTGAFSELYDRYSARLFGLAVKILRDRSLAEDVLQDVMINIWKKAPTYDRGRGTPAAWMTILCRNRCIDALRSTEKRRKRSASLDENLLNLLSDEAARNPLDAADQSLQGERVRKAMNNIPDEQRTLIELAYFNGLSQSEISSELDLPLGTVKTRMRLGMQKLRHQLIEKRNVTG